MPTFPEAEASVSLLCLFFPVAFPINLPDFTRDQLRLGSTSGHIFGS